MGIQNLNENVLLVTLPEQPNLTGELETVNKLCSDGCEQDVIVDFYQVKMLTSECICSLMILDRLLNGLGHKLILCNLSPEIKEVFTRTGLETSFHFADDDFAALQSVKSTAYFYG